MLVPAEQITKALVLPRGQGLVHEALVQPLRRQLAILSQLRQLLRHGGAGQRLQLLHVQLAEDALHRDVAGQVPQLAVNGRVHKGMAEHTVENGVEAAVVQLAAALLVKLKYVIRVEAEVFPVYAEGLQAPRLQFRLAQGQIQKPEGHQQLVPGVFQNLDRQLLRPLLSFHGVPPLLQLIVRFRDADVGIFVVHQIA